MFQGLVIAALAAAAALFFSTLNFALRDFSRARLHQWLKRHDREQYFDPTIGHIDEIAFVTAVIRLFSNAAILIGILAIFHDMLQNQWLQYLSAFCVTGIVAAFVSVAIPLAIARHAGELTIGLFVRFLYALRIVMRPAIALQRTIDRLVGRAAGPQTEEQEQQQLEEQILSAVEEGEKEGIVDEQEREMIESVIEFRDDIVREVMTARTDIVALDATADLAAIRELFGTTGHSRIPVYEGTLDHILGVLYARDLLVYVGEVAASFDIRKAFRPAFFVPETTPLRHLLRDFRMQKIHMGIVLDEYGGTAGLVTIEDILEQLVGEISDEHEPHEPAMIRKIDDRTWEVDARSAISDVNRSLPITLPEDGEVHTLGGFVATMIGRIPEKGITLSIPGARMLVLDAEPQRINRIRVEVTAPPPEQPN